ncbi:MAG TPA: cupin domain-containing protein [Caulobacteraceae bacterium]|jgi:hypothetical protein|nr:cupin domain-containing protein [Caulobacteraceae bacterium]
MGLRFIFMLTRNDRTVADAHDHLRAALEAGVRHIGFKDVGLPVDDLKRLAREIRRAGARSYLEVVSLDRETEAASARAALEIGIDVLLGGTRAAEVLPIIAGAGVEYCPFPGQIAGHPSVLEGSVAEIAASAAELAAHDGVHGLDLLAYRSAEAAPALIAAVCAAAGGKPVFVAGSIDGPERIAAVRAAGAAGFTIGTAALDGKYPAENGALPAQLAAIVRDVARLNGHISPHHKQSAATAPRGPPDREAGAHRRLGAVAGWRFDRHADSVFLVRRGRLRMRLRDREEIVEPGEFIVVPHGVEHCPVALGEACEVVLMTPGAGMSGRA